MAKMLVINKDNKEKAEQIFENLKNNLITFEEIKSFFDCDDNQAMEYNKVFENMYHLFYYSDLISNSYLASHVFEDEKINRFSCILDAKSKRFLDYKIKNSNIFPSFFNNLNSNECVILLHNWNRLKQEVKFNENENESVYFSFFYGKKPKVKKDNKLKKENNITLMKMDGFDDFKDRKVKVNYVDIIKTNNIENIFNYLSENSLMKAYVYGYIDFEEIKVEFVK